MLKKGMIVGVFCLLMLVSTQIVTAKDYPEEEGPYKIILQAKCFGYGGSGPDKLIHFGPFWYLDDASIQYADFLGATCFISNDSSTDYCELDYNNTLCLFGFKGYAPGFGMWFIKALIPLAKIRIIGICDEIIVL